MQFAEGLSDRDAAEAVRTRIDWKYLLGLGLSDPGFDYSILSRFRDRLIEGHAEMSLLQQLLEKCKALGLVRARSDMRTDSTHVLASIRRMNRSCYTRHARSMVFGRPRRSCTTAPFRICTKCSCPRANAAGNLPWDAGNSIR